MAKRYSEKKKSAEFVMQNASSMKKAVRLQRRQLFSISYNARCQPALAKIMNPVSFSQPLALASPPSGKVPAI